LSQISLAWQRGSVRENAIGSIRWPIPKPNPPIGRGAKISQKISYASQIIANFVPNFVAMATGVSRGKMQLAAFDGPSPKTPIYAQKSHKNLLRKPSYSPFCPKFRCHGNGIRSGKMRLAAFDGPSPKTPHRRKNLVRKLSYSPFYPKFRCHGNGGRSGNNAIAGVRWPIPENPPIGAKITQKSPTQVEL